jgi:universal stress protein A
MTPHFKKILVATDFSTASGNVIDYARLLSQRFGASLHVLHVIEDPLVAGGGTEVYVSALLALREELGREAQKRLAELEAVLPGIPVTIELLEGQPAQVIAKTAANREVDLIVMGTHGRSGVAHLLLGSVAERVVRIAPCPVLTVRAGSAEVPVRAAVAAEMAPAT